MEQQIIEQSKTSGFKQNTKAIAAWISERAEDFPQDRSTINLTVSDEGELVAHESRKSVIDLSRTQEVAWACYHVGKKSLVVNRIKNGGTV